MTVHKPTQKTLLLRSWSNTHGRSSYFLAYTLCFTALAFLVFSQFIINEKTLITVHDALNQHFPALIEYRRWLREICKNLLVNHSLEIPLWNYQIGQGADMLTTLHYYVVGDPLNLLSVLVPKESQMEWFYSALIILRIYLAGLAFTAYCRFHQNGRFATLLGALLYAFSFWTIITSVRHPYFENPLIYFPLILLGMDWIFAKRKPFLFIGMLSVALISNFYFAYMICLFVLLYAVFRYIMLFGRIHLRQLFPWLAKFAGFSAISFLLASFIFIPVVMLLMSTQRSQADNFIPLLYSAKYIWGLLGAFIGGQSGYYSLLGYTAFGVVGVCLLFLQRKKNRALKWGFLLLTLMLLVPFAGHLLNGFSYVTNRFVWVYNMLIAYILVKMYPELLALSPKQKTGLILCTAIYSLLCLVNQNNHTTIVLGSVVLLCLLVLFLVTIKWSNPRRTILFRSTVLGMLVLCLFFQAWSQNSPQAANYVESFNDSNTTLKKLTSTQSSVLKELPDSDQWRYSRINTDDKVNSALIQNLNGLSYYWSLADGNISNFQTQIALRRDMDYRYWGLDKRTLLELLAAVKYSVTPKNNSGLLPYGYQKSSVQSDTAAVYENINYLPMAYTYESFISLENFEALSTVEKQQAMLQGVVLAQSEFPMASPVFTDVKPDISIMPGKNVTMESGKFIVIKAGSTAAITLEGAENAESYFYLKNLNYQGISPRDSYDNTQWEALSTYKKNKITDSTRYWEEGTALTVSVKAENSHNTLLYRTPKDNFYCGIHDFLVNLGYQEDSVNEITITFPEPGIYTYDDLAVLCQPMENVDEYAAALREDTVESLDFGTNRISGTITLDKPKILSFSVPYSKGWTATVNGQPAQLKQANLMYMALELGEGTHQIELHYTTPYLKIGLFLSVVGLLALLGLVLFYRLRIPPKNSGAA